MTTDCFVGLALKDMMSKGVRIEFVKGKDIAKNAYSYFSTTKKGKNPIFCIHYFDNSLDNILYTFIHEYCHFLQWKYGCKIYKDSYKSLDKHEKWLSHKIETLDIEHIRLIQKLELDCDKRVLQIIKKYDLDVDIADYCRESNSYILSHNYIYEHRDFNLGVVSLEEDAKVLMPSRLLYINELSKSFPEHRKVCVSLFQHTFFDKSLKMSFR
jgi:hypothetical protein